MDKKYYSTSKKMRVELLISEITGSVLDYPVPHTKMSCIFSSLNHTSFTYHGIYYINTISNKITEHYWPHKTTLYDNKSSLVCHR